MPAVGEDDVVPRLWAAVEADDQIRFMHAGEVIDHRPLTGIAEAEVDDQDGRFAHRRRFPVPPSGVVGRSGVPSGGGDSAKIALIACMTRSIAAATLPRLTISCLARFRSIVPSFMPMVMAMDSAVSSGFCNINTLRGPISFCQNARTSRSWP